MLINIGRGNCRPVEVITNKVSGNEVVAWSTELSITLLLGKVPLAGCTKCAFGAPTLSLTIHLKDIFRGVVFVIFPIHGDFLFSVGAFGFILNKTKFPSSKFRGVGIISISARILKILANKS